MQVKRGNIWNMPTDNNSAICVTTNGIVKRDGSAVMGAGIAKQARDLYHVDRILGDKLRANGNHVYDLGVHQSTSRHSFTMLSFPTKHDWRDMSDPILIQQSARELITLANQRQFTHIYLTKPGCALGGLDWESQVKPMLECILDDRFVIMDR